MNNPFLILNTSCGQILIDTTTIVRVKASSNYSKIYFSDNTILVTTKLLKWFEKKLDEQYFIRLNRSHLVNNLFFKANQFVENGIVLQNGDFIQIARRRKKNILNQLQAA